jgi:flagellar hook-length control protein FliK
MSQSQSNSAVDGEKQPFGEILDRQDRADNRTEKQGKADSSSGPGGNSLHKGGKELPGTAAAADSHETETVGTEDGSSEVDSSASLEPVGSGLISTDTPVTSDIHIPVVADSLQNTTTNGVVSLDFDSVTSYSMEQGDMAASLAGTNSTAASASRTTLLPSSPGVAIPVQPEGEVGDISLDDLANVQQSAEMDDAELLDSLRQLMTSDTAKVKTSTALTSTSQPVGLAPNAGVSPLTDPVSTSGVKAAPGLLQMTSVVGDSGWDGEFAGRVNMLVKGGIQEAKIQLSPPELGRLEIKISMDGDSAKVMFSVDNVAARDAIEQAMPRLRELLGQGGLQLSHGEVADHSQSQQGRDNAANEVVTTYSGLSVEDDGTETTNWQLGISSSASTVDYYI